MVAALIVFSVFAGLALVIATVAGSILIANGKLTLPHTNARRVQQAKAELDIASFRLERERVQMMLDAQIDLRLNRAALPEGEPVGS